MKHRRPEITEQEAECGMRTEDERASRRLSVACRDRSRIWKFLAKCSDNRAFCHYRIILSHSLFSTLGFPLGVLDP